MNCRVTRLQVRHLQFLEAKMNIGMLWFDNDAKSSLDTKIERAASYYRTKYGRTPTLCFVHPSMLPANASSPSNSELSNTSDNGASKEGQKIIAGGVEVRSHRSVLPNHFWIGVNN